MSSDPDSPLLGRGIPASPGRGSGELHVDVDDALDAIDAGRRVVLALDASTPGDIPAMVRAAAVIVALEAVGSHATVVCRAADVPAVVAVEGLRIGADHLEIDGQVVPVGARLTIDGTLGTVTRDPAGSED